MALSIAGYQYENDFEYGCDSEYDGDYTYEREYFFMNMTVRSKYIC